ncbi:MAG: hypothetical protein WA939_13555 [Nodosilinea sp.]
MSSLHHTALIVAQASRSGVDPRGDRYVATSSGTTIHHSAQALYHLFSKPVRPAG